MGQAFQGELSSIIISQDKTSSGDGKEVRVSLDSDLISLDFTEDMFTSSMSGSLVVADKSGWLSELGGLVGNEWLTFTIDASERDRNTEGYAQYPITNTFKVYKISSNTSEANTLVTYSLNFTTYQYLIDSVKLEKHLNNQHIGPIATETSLQIDNESEDSPIDQDVGFVNKLFQAGLFAEDIKIDKQFLNKPILDIEATANWLNFIPSYLDDRNNTNVVDNNYWWNNNYSRGDMSRSDARPKQIFEVLNELAENSVSKENPNAANFLCWNDLRGWHFRSIDSYLREPKLDRSYSHSVANPATDENGGYDRVIELEVKKQVDFMDLLNMQALSSEVVYYELNPENPFAAYYLSLPSGMQGLQKVMDPSGLNTSIGRTVLDEQAIIQGGLTYDYLEDHKKWSKVEKYPILPDKINLSTQYTDPSFLEIPPKYLNSGVGNQSWLGTIDSMNASSPVNSAYSSADPRGTGTYYNNQWRMLNPQEYFKSQFLNQTTLDGAKFRTVHDKIKTPIIKALREYYEVCLQRLFYEHNLIIEAGINTLESGEGKLGRGPDNKFCEYCISRDEALSINYDAIITNLGQEYFDNDIKLSCRQFVPGTPLDPDGGYYVTDDLCIENRIIGFYNNSFSDELNDMSICTAKRRDLRTTHFTAGLGGLPVDPTTLPIFESNVIPFLDQEFQGLEYPRCFTDEPLLPYDELPVDCVTIKNKFLEIPSECGLVREHLGPEYVSPAIRGWHGDPINFNNNMFWNGYWINPIFGLPNIKEFMGFFDVGPNRSSTYLDDTTFQFFESTLFLKDFYEYDSSGFIPLPYQATASENGWENQLGWSSGGGSSFTSTTPFGNSIFDQMGGDGLLEGIPSHLIFFNWETTSIDEIQTCNDPDCGFGGGQQNQGGLGSGEGIENDCRCLFGTGGFGSGINPDSDGQNGILVGSKRGFERNIEVEYVTNRMYDFVKTCAIPQLCGQYDYQGDTIQVPYVSKQVEELVKQEGTGDDGTFGGGGQGNVLFYSWKVVEWEISEVEVKWPDRYSNGSPYDYGIIRTAPFFTHDYKNNWIDSNYISILKQFGTSPYTTGSDGVVGQTNYQLGNPGTDKAPTAVLRGVLAEQGANTAYVPNRNLGLYDQSAPVYNKEDWQRFLDCGGTCVGGEKGGTDNVVLESSKSLEYAKYCTYAWNRYWSTPEHQLMYRRAQMNLIQSQEIEITLPMDINLEIGMIVGVDIPLSPSIEITPGQTVRDENLNTSSGRFLVTGIRRTFTGKRDAMKVRLNRDSLPFDPNKGFQDSEQQ